MNQLRRVDHRVDDHDFLLTMLRPAPLRATAHYFGSHHRAVLHQRHCLLHRLAALPKPKLDGAVMLVRVWWKLNGLRDRIAPAAVLVACTQAGELRAIVDDRARTWQDPEPLLRSHFTAGATIVHAGLRRGPFQAAAARLGLSYIPRTEAVPTELWHARDSAARAYGRDLHNWLRHFRGVAQATLPLYVAWHDALAAIRHAPDPTRAWLDLWDRALASSASTPRDESPP